MGPIRDNGSDKFFGMENASVGSAGPSMVSSANLATFIVR